MQEETNNIIARAESQKRKLHEAARIEIEEETEKRNAALQEEYNLAEQEITEEAKREIEKARHEVESNVSVARGQFKELQSKALGQLESAYHSQVEVAVNIKLSATALKEEHAKALQTMVSAAGRVVPTYVQISFDVARCFWSLKYGHKFGLSVDVKRKSLLEEFEVPSPAVLRLKVEADFRGIGFPEFRRELKAAAESKLEARKITRHKFEEVQQKAHVKSVTEKLVSEVEKLQILSETQQQKLHAQIRGHVTKRSEALKDEVGRIVRELQTEHVQAKDQIKACFRLTAWRTAWLEARCRSLVKPILGRWRFSII